MTSHPILPSLFGTHNLIRRPPVPGAAPAQAPRTGEPGTPFRDSAHGPRAKRLDARLDLRQWINGLGGAKLACMCNLYAMMKARAEVAALVRAMTDRNNNQPPMSGIFPDYAAPVVVMGEDGRREMRDMRWGMPSSKKALLEAATKRADGLRKKGTEFDFDELLKLEPDKGTTNVRNTTSPKTGRTNAHWQPWLGPANRCLVPFTSFAEPDQDHEMTRQNIWFALGEERPLAFFAGIWTPHACVRMKSKGWEEIEAFGFLTTESAEPVATYHKKAMPVILTEAADWDLWLSGGSWDEVKHLQRPRPEGLEVVARGVRKDEPA